MCVCMFCMFWIVCFCFLGGFFCLFVFCFVFVGISFFEGGGGFNIVL